MSSNGKSDSIHHKKTTDALTEIVEEAKEKGKELLEEGLATAREAFEEQKEYLKDKAEELTDKKVGEVADEIKAYVRKHPWQSLGIAVAAGLILGLALKSDK